jgi:trigger factor
MEQTTTTTEFQNDLIRFTLHQRPQCVVECDVEALEPLVLKAHQHAVRAVAKQVSLPGFRKGKAPEAMICKNHPKEIDQEWQQAIADLCVKECIKLGTIRLLARDPRITYKMKSHSLKGALLSLFLEIEPLIPHVDAQKMQKQPIKRPDVNDEKIDETIRQSLLFFATWEAVHDRPIQQGDFVSLDVDIIETTPAIPLFSNTRFEVTDKSMAKWMFDLVIGKNKGDQVEGISTPDENASEEEKQELTNKKVCLTIRSVDTALLPALDDAFAKQVGVATVAEMRENITRLLNNQADAHVLEEERKQVSTFLLDSCPFDLPLTLIRKETEFRFHQLWNDTSFQQYWQNLSQEEKTKIIQTVQAQSEKAVRLFFLCRQLLTDASLPVLPEDLDTPSQTPLDALVDIQNQTPEKSPEIRQAEAYSRCVLEKAQDFVWRNASTPA